MALRRLTLIVFVVLQAADGLLTYEAVTLFGPSVEANQLLVAWIGITGLGPALLGAKLLACACGAVLYVLGLNRILVGLTALYLFGAIVPWLKAVAAIPYS